MGLATCRGFPVTRPRSRAKDASSSYSSPPQLLAGQHRRDDPAHPRLLEPRHQRVQMRLPRQDEPLLGLLDQLGRHRRGRRRELLHHLPGQRVHEPGLPTREGERPVHRLLAERLPLLGRVLRVQGRHLAAVEASEPQRLRLDVERTGRAHPLRIRPGRDAVVPHVPQAAQHDRPWEGTRTRREPGPELAEDGAQALSPERVYFVEQQDERTRTRERPRGERRPQHRQRGRGRPGRRLEVCRQIRHRHQADLLEDGRLRLLVVVLGGLPRLAGERQRGIAAFGGQSLCERSKRRGLARLPRRVHDKVGAAVDGPARLGIRSMGGSK